MKASHACSVSCMQPLSILAVCLAEISGFVLSLQKLSWEEQSSLADLQRLLYSSLPSYLMPGMLPPLHTFCTVQVSHYLDSL